MQTELLQTEIPAANIQECWSSVSGGPQEHNVRLMKINKYLFHLCSMFNANPNNKFKLILPLSSCVKSLFSEFFHAFFVEFLTHEVLSHQLKISSVFVATSKNVLWLNSFVFLQILKCQMGLKTVHGTGYHFFPHLCFYGLNFSWRRMTGIVAT